MFMKKYYNKIWKKVNNKGHERITFMLIPHGEANIISIQLSKFTIYFGFFITLAILGASIISTELQGNIKPEVDQLYNTNRTYYYEREQYVEKFNQIEKNQEKLKTKLNSLFEMANISEGDASIFLDDNSLRKTASLDMQEESARFTSHMVALLDQTKDKTSKIVEPQEVDSQLLQEFAQVYNQQKSFKYSSEVVSYRELYLDIKQTEYLMSVFENFLETRDVVQKSLPYYWPIAGGHFTSFYGPRFSPFGYTSEFHLGVDLADRIGTPVYAAADGKVAQAFYSEGYGRNILLQHKFGYSSRYAHLSKIVVFPGQIVTKGQLIGNVGETGRATGPHLHFEVMIDGRHVNPLPYLTTI